MKAVVLEIKNDKVAVLAEDGNFSEVLNSKYAVGDTIEMEAIPMLKMSRRFMTTVAGLAAAMMLIFGGGALAYNTPVAHVSMDVNPSIMYAVNMLDRVIDVELVNSTSAGVIVDTIKWDNEKISVVIEKTIAALKANNYLNDKKWYENDLLIGVNSSSTEREQRLILAIKNELQYIIFNETAKQVDIDDCQDLVIGIGDKELQDASILSDELDCEVTPSKLNLVLKLDASLVANGKAHLTDAEIAIWINKSVEAISEQIRLNQALTAANPAAGDKSKTILFDDDQDGDFDDCGDLLMANVTNASKQAMVVKCSDDCISTTAGICTDDCNDSNSKDGIVTKTKSGLDDNCNCSSTTYSGIDCKDCLDASGICSCATNDAAEKAAEVKAEAAERAAEVKAEAADAAADKEIND